MSMVKILLGGGGRGLLFIDLKIAWGVSKLVNKLMDGVCFQGGFQGGFPNFENSLRVV